MKILLHTNAPWAPTGYGQQTAQLVPQLADDGHDVAISAFYGLQGTVLKWGDGSGHLYDVYGCHLHPYGDDIVLGHATKHFGGDIRDGLVVTLIDVWVYNAAQFTRANVACWVPIDHSPVPPRVLEFFQVSGAVPIAMSRHGEGELRNAGLDPVYVPHGIDTQVFRPQDKTESRRLLGIPEDRFLVGMVAANKGSTPPRKGFPQAFAAFAQFHRDHPEAMLYLHTEVTGAAHGINLLGLAHAVGLPGDAIVIPDQYRLAIGAHPAEYMAQVYSALDVLLNPSLGEGFGIPIVEAQACGTPVIVTDWTAMPELCGAGWRVDGDLLYTDQGAFWKVPSVGGILSALESAYKHRGDEGLARQATGFAADYDQRTVYANYWRPALERLEERCRPLADPADLIQTA